MKCLTRMYHDQGRDVIFYENAAQPQKRQHAAIMAVPLPYSLGETAPAFFKVRFHSQVDVLVFADKARHVGSYTLFRRRMDATQKAHRYSRTSPPRIWQGGIQTISGQRDALLSCMV